MVLRVLQTGGGEACTNQCGWMRRTERCGWVCKAKRSSGLVERSGLAGQSRGLAGQSGGLAERERQRSFVEQQSFWVFPLQFPLPSTTTIDPCLCPSCRALQICRLQCHVVYSLVLFPPYYLMTWCETHTPCHLFLFPPYYLTMRRETHTPRHLFLFPSILSDNMAIYIPLEFIRSVLRYNL